MAEDHRLRRVSELALGLPGAERETTGSHASFKVRKRVFAYFVNDHHGDGIVAVWCKVLPGENSALIAADPKRFYMPAYVGPRGWVGLRLDVGRVPWVEVKELLQMSHSLVKGNKTKN